MFINCRHCNALVATDPATDLPPERCPRCAGVLRLPAPAASVPVAAGSGTPDAIAAGAVPAETVASKPPPTPEPAGGDPADAAGVSRSAATEPGRPPQAAASAGAQAIGPIAEPATPAPPPRPVQPPAPVVARPAEGGAGPATPAASGSAAVAPGEATTAPAPMPAVAALQAPTSPPLATPDVDTAVEALPTEPPAKPVQASQATASDAAAVSVPSPAFTRGAAVAAARRQRAWAQPAAVAGLSLLLALQIVLADRDRLAADAQWRPLVGAVCGVLRCSVPPWREPEALVLLSRDVRPHPDHRGALRATASFRNDAQWPQPWPQLVLVLSDVDGHAVAARAFAPDEYLGGAPGAPLLSSGQAVDIALDIREPSVETVSYAWDLR